MSANAVSRTKYDQAIEAKNRAVARAREIRAGGGGYRGAMGVAGGTAIAGVLDAKMGEGTATYAGLIIGVAGVAMGNSDAVNVGTGMLTPAIYRMTNSRAKAYFATNAAPNTGVNVPA